MEQARTAEESAGFKLVCVHMPVATCRIATVIERIEPHITFETSLSNK